eukprot:TRINITY_DN5709_c0_g1_i1.p1 TRINITY_DN5709_c0_g1~~TRINITY_DN5709_c0_g1_i1.p1  ORF type:complete len:286 (-),score=50.36 TRINITY_DN5709_c0_g1_i1:1-858(-)
MGNKASVDETDSMTRVYCVSDLHSDEEDNMELLEKLVAKTPKHPDINVLIVAGDISGDCKVIEETLLLLLQVFPTIFYCPGNNELRMHKKEKGFDSIEKFEKVMKICEKIGVHVTAKKINGVWIVPLFSWYTPTFSDDWDGDFSYQRGWLDFRRCRFPTLSEKYTEDPDVIANYFLNLNKDHVHAYDEPVITFSHFLPRKELLPPFQFLKPTLPFVTGCKGIEKQIREIGSIVHVYGHTHVNNEFEKNGVRYVQNALGHPRERKAWWRSFDGSYTFKLVYTHKEK